MTGCDDGVVRLFDMRSDGEISRYCYNFRNKNEGDRSGRNSIVSKNSQFDSPGVVSVDFSKSGRLFYASYADKGCVIWDTLRGEVLGGLGEGHEGLVNKIGVSPDGEGVFTSSWDGTIKVWSV